jgi:hypothetical protein
LSQPRRDFCPAASSSPSGPKGEETHVVFFQAETVRGSGHREGCPHRAARGAKGGRPAGGERRAEYELGKVALAGAFDIKQGEERSFDFVLPFELLKSGNDVLKEAGGAFRMLGKAAAFVSAESSTYKVTATADVKGAALDPADAKPILLT